MTKEQKQLELTALKESFEAKAINSDQYVDGITHIMNLPETARFSATKNLGLQVFEARKLIKVGLCEIPYNDISKMRKLRIATFLKDNSNEEKGQREHYEN